MRFSKALLKTVSAVFLLITLGCASGGGGSRVGVTYHHSYGPGPWNRYHDRPIYVPVPVPPGEPALEAVPLPTPEPDLPPELPDMPDMPDSMGMPDGIDF